MISVINARVIKNFVALTILQGGNYVLPLIMIPFLVRVLGMKTFGDWAFAVAFVSIFRTVVAYGFDMTATRDVCVSREDRAFVSELYVAIVLTRLTLFALSCLAVVGLGHAFSNVGDVLLLTLISMLILVGEVLFPIWLFQGMEQMATITRIRLGYRAAFVIAVVALVRGPDDLLLIPVLEALGSLAAGLIAMWVAFTQYRLSLRWPSSTFIKSQVLTGASVFISNIGVHFCITINTVLLGVIAGPVAVAQYSIAEKVFYAIWGMLGPVVQALFPALSRLYAQDRLAFEKATCKITILYFLAKVVLSIPVFFLADRIVTFIAGTRDPGAAQALEILAITLGFTMGSLFSPLLIIQDLGKRLVATTYSTMIVNMIVVVPLVYYYGAVGAACALLIGQLFNTYVQIVANSQVLLPQFRFHAVIGRPH